MHLVVASRSFVKLRPEDSRRVQTRVSRGWSARRALFVRPWRPRQRSRWCRSAGARYEPCVISDAKDPCNADDAMRGPEDAAAPIHWRAFPSTATPIESELSCG
jgi:hypothetical protein